MQKPQVIGWFRTGDAKYPVPRTSSIFIHRADLGHSSRPQFSLAMPVVGNMFGACGLKFWAWWTVMTSWISSCISVTLLVSTLGSPLKFDDWTQSHQVITSQHSGRPQSSVMSPKTRTRSDNHPERVWGIQVLAVKLDDWKKCDQKSMKISMAKTCAGVAHFWINKPMLQTNRSLFHLWAPCCKSLYPFSPARRS